MQALQNLLDKLGGIIWGEYVLIPLLTLVGIYLTLGLKAMPWRLIPRAFSMLWQGRTPDKENKGDISPFQALMTALSATIGTGNIAGVATAIVFSSVSASVLFIFWYKTMAIPTAKTNTIINTILLLIFLLPGLVFSSLMLFLV